jgi:hypothetical protein
MARTHNNDFAYTDSGDALLEFFSKAGSLFTKKGSHYGNEATALELFRPCWTTNKLKSMQLAMWLRDCRGGSGNRSGTGEILKWLANNHPEWIRSNIHIIPEIGRWKDLIFLFDTPCEADAIRLWIGAISKGDGLAAKWAPREDKNKDVFHKLRRAQGMSPKDFRKLLVKNTQVVETPMCSGEWFGIEYNHTPSVAMARYANAFQKHDSARFTSWKDSLVDPESDNKVNASVLFPYDCTRTAKAGDDKLADAQFAALPDFLGEAKQRIMCFADFSGSMMVEAAGSIQAIDVANSLALYCSDRLGEENPFYRKFIPFSSVAKLQDWRGKSFHSQAINRFGGFCGSTNLAAGMDLLLDSAKMFNISNDQMPNVLMIMSDMQFDQAVSGADETTVENRLKEWEAAGYERPKIVYWNLAGYKNSPWQTGSGDKPGSKGKNIALISGFSPAVLSAVFSGEDFSPMAIMERAISKYEVVIPQ